MQRSVFDHLPRRGAWRSVLLLDGSVGIGGDPVALLHRVAELLRPDGRLLVETQAPGVPSESLKVRIETSGSVGPWFPWSVVSIDDADSLASSTGFRVHGVLGGRWALVRAYRSIHRSAAHVTQVGAKRHVGDGKEALVAGEDRPPVDGSTG